jgi:nicotinate phosphoribosyltransferase
MAWPSEEEAFLAFAEIYPDRSVFLIDTINTLKSGIENAIKVGKILAAKGEKFGVRLDSGDIHYLSVEVRKRLDEAGLREAFISVSNELDESIIQATKEAGAPIDIWGVGTHMVTGRADASFPGVYKIVASDDETGKLIARIKFSDNPEKTSNPGIKQVWRIIDKDGLCVADVLALEDPSNPDLIEKGKAYSFWHPQADYRRFHHILEGCAVPLLVEKIKNGKPVANEPTLLEIRKKVSQGLDSLDQSYKRLLNPYIYKVSVTWRLRALKLELIESFLGDI